MIKTLPLFIFPNKQTMVEVLQLTVEEDDRGSPTPRLYTCEQLNDLQSKLMLVAGATEKSSAQKVSNERFLEVNLRKGDFFENCIWLIIAL